MHYLDLTVDVLLKQQVALGEGLAGVLNTVGLAHAPVRGGVLPMPQLLADAVVVPHVRRLVQHHRPSHILRRPYNLEDELAQVRLRKIRIISQMMAHDDIEGMQLLCT